MWYLTLRQATKPRDQWTVTLDQHLVWMKQQHQEGKILFSGPTTDGKYGVYVIRAGSKDEAAQLAGSDPYRRRAFAPLSCSNGKCIRSWAVDRSRRRRCRDINEREIQLECWSNGVMGPCDF